MNVILKDGSVKAYDAPMSAYDIARDLSEGLARVSCAAEVNGVAVDLRQTVAEDARVDILTFDHPEGKHAFWHTSSHILAQAVKRLYPETKLAIGPSIRDGFYYDFEREEGFGDVEIQAIENEMKKIVKEGIEISSFVLARPEAIALMESRNEPYKVELIRDLPEDAVLSFYQQGEFVDLCAGPHLMNVKPVKAMKLTSVAGAYWRGDEKNKMLTRIYGTAYPKKADLDAHLARIEEAKKRDHRRLGKEMGLFTLMEQGPGFPFFLPNGMILRNELMNYWREIHTRENYKEISTPIMLNRKLWETSGHWDHYQDKMYTTVIDEEDFAIKPMNCPGSLLVYNAQPHSYRDLPLRMAEVGLVHRHEKSGEMHGLMRVRSFSQDDAHIYMTPLQIKEEIKGVVRMIDEVYTKFGYTYHIELSTRPEDSMGEDADWEMATQGLREAVEEMGLAFVVNEGDGAFYGPKLDFHLEDSLGRTWQCGTIQLDFQLPQRFQAEYVGDDGEKHQPIMIHRVVFGSIERFIGILIEHFGGKFPTWLAPVQARLMPITDRQLEYARSIQALLKKKGIRAEVDERNEKIGFKVRQAQVEKVPYMLILGDQEEEKGEISLRLRDHQKNLTMPLADFVAKVEAELAERAMHSPFLEAASEPKPELAASATEEADE
ncbi:MAG: threonine--tRNA ligase [Clostridia bacterium]|nr:threonine--tRNA ligase [Clostridia bacterium]